MSAAAGATFEGEALRWAPDGDVLVVTLHREPGNALGLTALAELEALVAHVGAGAGGARALLFTSTARAGFCEGAALKELYTDLVARRAAGEAAGDTLAAVRSFIDRIHAVFDALDQAPMTTVAALHGVVFGGGFELALTCDVLIADKGARFAFPELRLGLIPGFGGVPRLRRDVGNAVVRDLLLSGRSLSATRAHELGLVSQVVARGEALPAALALAKQAARFAPHTVAAAKRFTKPLPEGLDAEKALFCELFGSPVVLEALARFAADTSALPYLPSERVPS
ncbi:MAG: enoyl-CoA hydratase/isomerase family protein [Deltaproteobacteria bacterium]|nr:enoyl-CoA hydratase/isomerase family protein [Deltaproteobacteria bacterium]